MTAHHTKDKGDLGVAKVFADLVTKGAMVLFPATEHAPFDLVSYHHGIFSRIQVKYRTSCNGAIKVYFKSTWADRHGLHVRPLDKRSVDLIAIYSPETDKCYYVDPQDHAGCVTLRLSPARNGQRVGVLSAEAFREIPPARPSSRKPPEEGDLGSLA